MTTELAQGRVITNERLYCVVQQPSYLVLLPLRDSILVVLVEHIEEKLVVVFAIKRAFLIQPTQDPPGEVF